MPTTDQTAAGFLDLALPKREWTHEAHFRVGLWHLLRFSEADSLERLRSGIRRYNEATGVANTETSGYHETMTRFYVAMIANFLDANDRSRDIEELADELIAACGDKRLPFAYYSEQRLLSTEARLGWVEPDLRPLPGA